jgi:alpha-ketoglutarate-dependent 2,4-dichlorophenoxyacetate dioxygenase
MAIKLTPLHSTLGAELRGVDLTRPVTHEVFAEIDTAFNRHRILVFPEQPVSDEQQLALSRLFGPLEVNPNCANGGRPTRPVLGASLDDGSEA